VLKNEENYNIQKSKKRKKERKDFTDAPMKSKLEPSCYFFFSCKVKSRGQPTRKKLRALIHKIP